MQEYEAMKCSTGYYIFLEEFWGYISTLGFSSVSNAAEEGFLFSEYLNEVL